MSLSTSTPSSGCLSSMAYQVNAKPMAISTITSPPNHHAIVLSPMSSSPRSAALQSPSSSSFFSPHPSTLSSFPNSPEYHHRPPDNQPHHTPPQHQHPYAAPSHHFGYSPSNAFIAPLSLHERRQRNKAASAKYRAKKNQQHGEMRTLITSLLKENELLLRQLDHVRRDNTRLKATCDRLRGKMLAEKMLRRMLRGSLSSNSSCDEPCLAASDGGVYTMQADMHMDDKSSDDEHFEDEDQTSESEKETCDNAECVDVNANVKQNLLKTPRLGTRQRR